MTVFAAVRCGVDKEQCEDTVLVGEALVRNDALELSTDSCSSICVADGVGGNAGGHFASAFVTDMIKSIGVVSDEAELRQVLSEINRRLIKESEVKGFPTAATTLMGVFFAADREYLANIGNTRAYVLQGKYLKQLTSDHTVYNRLLKMGRIDAANNSRKNEITNCFGGGNDVLFEGLSISLMQEYSTLLLTSDGIHDYIDIDKLESLLTANTLSIKTCSSIIQAVLAAGSRDDISIVLVQR